VWQVSNNGIFHAIGIISVLSYEPITRVEISFPFHSVGLGGSLTLAAPPAQTSDGKSAWRWIELRVRR
jgi:hypothetical protein